MTNAKGYQPINKWCAKCGKEKNYFGPPLELKEYKNKLYCPDCLKLVEGEDEIDGISMSEATDSEKLVKLLKLTEYIRLDNASQTKYLKTIKNIMVLFTVLFVIGIIIQGCI